MWVHRVLIYPGPSYAHKPIPILPVYRCYCHSLPQRMQFLGKMRSASMEESAHAMAIAADAALSSGGEVAGGSGGGRMDVVGAGAGSSHEENDETLMRGQSPPLPMGEAWCAEAPDDDLCRVVCTVVVWSLLISLHTRAFPPLSLSILQACLRAPPLLCTGPEEALRQVLAPQFRRRPPLHLPVVGRPRHILTTLLVAARVGGSCASARHGCRQSPVRELHAERGMHPRAGIGIVYSEDPALEIT